MLEWWNVWVVDKENHLQYATGRTQIKIKGLSASKPIIPLFHYSYAYSQLLLYLRLLLPKIRSYSSLSTLLGPMIFPLARARCPLHEVGVHTDAILLVSFLESVSVIFRFEIGIRMIPTWHFLIPIVELISPRGYYVRRVFGKLISTSWLKRQLSRCDLYSWRLPV